MKPTTNKKLTSEIGILPPAAIEIEEAVLGALLLTDKNIHFTAILNQESFYKTEHAKIFNAILQVIRSSRKPDILTVAEQLRKNKELTDCGGPGYIARLTNKISSDSWLEQHCLILKEKQMARGLINLGSELVKRAYDESISPFETEIFAVDSLGDIMNVNSLKTETSNIELGSEFIDDIYQAKEVNGINGVPTGFKELDKLTGGLQKKDLIILAARPGMGKTALALCIFLNAVLKSNKRFIFFSLEMGRKSLFKRLAAIHLKMSANKFRKGDVDQGEMKYIQDNLEAILTERLIMVDTCRTMQEIRMRIKKEKVKGDVDGVILDYLQLTKLGTKVSSREQEVSGISVGLKEIAMDEDLPLIALSQLSREVERRPNKRPQLSDLRESGSIEQDADQVWFLYRPNYYGLAEDGKEHVAKLIVDKHRNGELQDIELAYIHNQTNFINPDDYVSDNSF